MRLEQAAKSILVFGAALFCSCAHYPCDPAYIGPKARNAQMLEYYGYPRQTVEANVRVLHQKNRYVVERVEFPSALNVFGTENIRLDFYAQREEGKFPTILILPIAGGVDFCVESFARHFVSHGVNCAIVHNRRVDLDAIASAQEVEDYLRQAVLDGRQVLDYLVERRDVDSNKLGCLGVSLGGIKASLVAGADERLKCSVILLAGGSMADIALGSKLGGLRDYIKGLTEMGVSSDVIRAELTDKVATDPLALAEYVNAEDVLMYIAAFDHVVPRKCGDRLWNAIGKPEVVYLFSGHFTSLLYLPFAERESLSFFKRKFHLR